MQAIPLLLLFRHLHFFVIVGDMPQPPRLHLQSKQVFTYTDPLRVTVFNAAGDRLLRTAIPVGSSLDRTLPAGGSADQPALYLVQADPGMNGATFECDRPWGVMGNANNRLGVNGVGPQLFFYVPPDCTEFTLGAQSASPNEGARLTVFTPEGKAAGVLDGELDGEQALKISVPADGRDRIWSLTWAKSETTPAGLDDLNFWLDGKLTPLLFPDRVWAEQYGKALWERDQQARQ